MITVEKVGDAYKRQSWSLFRDVVGAIDDRE